MAYSPTEFRKNRLPAAVIFPTLADVVSFSGKPGKLERFHTLFHTITDRFPLAGLLLDHPLTVLQHDKVWEKLLAILDFMTCHPLPGTYPAAGDPRGGHQVH